MNMNTYIAGTVVEFTAAFVDDQGQPADPSTIVFRYGIGPSQGSHGTVTTLTYASASTPGVGIVARTGTGAYEAQVDTTGLSGFLTYVWQSTGTAQTIGTSVVTIKRAPL